MSSDDSSERPIDFTLVARFNPPNPDDTPKTLFTLGNTGFAGNIGGHFMHHSNLQQMLIYTDGSCPNNGQDFAVGGCAFVFKGGNLPEAINEGITSFCLKDSGPSGVVYPHINNRVELCAVIASVQFCAWNGEGCNEVVIATDSEYVVMGAMEYVAGWVKRGWQTTQKKEVKNMDLWELLFKEIQNFKEDQNLRVLFWRIPKEWNTIVDRGAKEVVATGEPRHSFTKILEVLV